jgi:hypothetical protein
MRKRKNVTVHGINVDIAVGVTENRTSFPPNLRTRAFRAVELFWDSKDGAVVESWRASPKPETALANATQQKAFAVPFSSFQTFTRETL